MQKSHLYFISMGNGTALANELTCEGCGVVLGYQSGAVQPSHYADSDCYEMARLTGPMSEATLAARMDAEMRVQAGDLAQDERLLLIAEPVQALGYLYRLRSERGSHVSVSAVIQFLFLASACTSTVLWVIYVVSIRPSTNLLAWAVATTVLAAFFLIVMIYRLVSDRRRAATRDLIAHLGRALAPLDPSPAELEEVLAILSEDDPKGLAAVLPVARLNAAIDSAKTLESARRTESHV